MKIAFLVEKFPTLSETFVLSQIVGLIQRGHEIDIYATYAEKSDKVHTEVDSYHLLQKTFYRPYLPKNYIFRLLKGIWIFLSWLLKKPIILLRTINVFKYGRYASSLRLLFESVPFLDNNIPTYDIIYCHFGMLGLKGMVLRNTHVIDGMLVTVFHGQDISGYLLETSENVYNPLFKEGDLFLPVSNYWKKRLIELGCPSNKIIVHHMGIEGKKFYFNPPKPHPEDSICIITVARLVEKKGIEYGIKAIARMKEHHRKIHYLIVGDGPLKTDLQALIFQLNVESIVTLAGWKQQHEVVKLLQKSHILLAPSVTASSGDKEGIPVALMEAMATGRIVISTFHSGIPELIEDGKSGFLVPERNAEILAEKLEWMLDHKQSWSDIRESARKVIEKRYNNYLLNDCLESIFFRILKEPYRSLKTKTQDNDQLLKES